jgi:outer membrane lipoprotein-sorting protein
VPALLGVAALLSVTTAASPADAAEDDSLGQLMALLAKRQQGSAEFQQSQYLSALKQPQRSSGILTYEAPDHLEERTLKPREQSMVLDHGMLTLSSGKRQRTLRLQDYPEIAPLIDSVRATLAGDRASLEQRFDVSVEGNLEHWQLLLKPRDEHLAATVQRIRIGGQRDAILEVEVRQSDGDHSLMTIQPRE